MTSSLTELQTLRQHWMSVLAKANYDDLQQRWSELEIQPEYQFIRPAQTGLVQLQGRMGGTGRAFNAGDATVTRAVARLASGETGYSYVKGRNKEHAALACVIDALLQNRDFQQRLQDELIQPLAEQYQKILQQRREAVAESKVDFFTMVRGED